MYASYDYNANENNYCNILQLVFLEECHIMYNLKLVFSCVILFRLLF